MRLGKKIQFNDSQSPPITHHQIRVALNHSSHYQPAPICFGRELHYATIFMTVFFISGIA
jgi:hypothetical protein